MLARASLAGLRAVGRAAPRVRQPHWAGLSLIRAPARPAAPKALAAAWPAPRSLPGALYRTAPTLGGFGLPPPDPREANCEVSHKLLSIPNILTLARIACTPVIALWVFEEHYVRACAGFFLAGFSDWLDGYIAKRYNMKSVMGSYLDPLADKVLVGCLTVALAAKSLLSAWLVALVVARDAFLVGAVCYARYRTVPPPITLQRFFDTKIETYSAQPTYLSKVNTFGQLGLVCLALLSAAFGSHAPVLPDVIVPALTALVAATTGASWADYARQLYGSGFKKPELKPAALAKPAEAPR
eukprot:tig00020572_g11544.t1